MDATRPHPILGGVALTVGLALALAACGGGTSNPSAGLPTGTTGAVTTSGISTTECNANKAAGKITFETSYDYAAAVSILDVVAADQLGYFKDMCLDVVLKPGFSTDNVALLSANKVQLSSLGSDSEVLAADAHQAGLLGVLTYSRIPIEELITPAASKVTDLTQLDGTTIGIKGALPYEVAAMLAKAGVNIASLKQVQVGYDPTIINQGRIAALPVYKSNEIYQLNSEHEAYHVFDPATFDVAGSFAAVVTNRTFATAHPTAVEDFLRADIEGFNWAYTHQAQGVVFAMARVDPKLYLTPAGSAFRWATESSIAAKSFPSGVPLGTVDMTLVNAEYAQDVSLKLIPAGVNTAESFDLNFAKDIYNGTTLIWPTQFTAQP